ncbi:hypothetical protein EBME_1925 [bacterium endosymbiont of Mortierella elongata FMR23-6]|nr:hypothetical protein EBME_1925 [bacterium endosymbiont of Mortierella elongata FMR23-6]
MDSEQGSIMQVYRDYPASTLSASDGMFVHSAADTSVAP